MQMINGQNTQDDLFAWWKFNTSLETEADDEEDERGMSVVESVSGQEYGITGLAKFVPGVKGSAIKFDGFSSYVEGSQFGSV